MQRLYRFDLIYLKHQKTLNFHFIEIFVLKRTIMDAFFYQSVLLYLIVDRVGFIQGLVLTEVPSIVETVAPEMC